ncbi:hypothetical protein I532_04045 [Brevibacillus borstelensis AK1]|uniref:Uncharacterized protein n=1 Tax=Brevibacillus borstelensis AK1 TaxID=1300222 RepID=M8DMP1_9BACL|nr:hypothetical protein [Brevibacillus borstelensis]EMT54747.1 hypothetical protein I532_04045 [Brevibacillus borstelensis AK1]
MEILNTVNTGGEGATLFFGIWFAVCAVFSLVGVFECNRDGWYGFMVLFGIVGIIATLLSTSALADYATPKPAKYEVLITDMAAFDTDKYEIIEQRGKIFVIQEVTR